MNSIISNFTISVMIHHKKDEKMTPSKGKKGKAW